MYDYVGKRNRMFLLRQGDGVLPMRWNEIIGKVVKRDYEKDEKIDDTIDF